MMCTHFFNVGHGEAVLIETHSNGEPRWILRDFGRSRFAKHTDFSMSVSRLLSRDCCYPLHYIKHPHDPPHLEKLDAVLSHAHEDHFNGFKALYDLGCRSLFENAYIPMFRMNDLNTLGGILIKYSIFLYRYYGSSTKIGINAKNWLLAAPILAGLSKNLSCVVAGHTLTNWETNKILWPVAQKNLSRSLVDKFEAYLKINELPNDYLNEESEQIRSQLVKFYQESVEQIKGGEFNEEQVENCIRTVNDILIVDLGDFKRKCTNPIGLNNYAYRPTIDNHSLMFEMGEDGEQHLYLSDADDKTIQAMLQHNSIQNKKYRLIKSAHHGNRGAKALANSSISADEIVNCCGPAHPNYKGPCLSYQSISKKLICTDWNYGSKKWKNLKQFIIQQSYCIRK